MNRLKFLCFQALIATPDMTLNLLTYQPIPAVVPLQPDKRYSPLLALFLSFVFPGLGYFYLRAWRQAAWIMGLELLSLGVITAGTGQVHATAIIAAPSLYLFAIIDAYFRAREWNAGVTSWMVGANPRVTAILNLLTKGFGYFYLGDRVKGVVCFVAMSATQAVLLLHTNVWTQVLAISLQAAVALDGYRVARERLFQSHPELHSLPIGDAGVSANVIDAANPDRFTPGLAMAFFAAFGVSMLIAYGSLLALNGHSVTSNGTLEDGPTGLTYRNSHEGIELTVPEGWTPFSSKNTVTSLRDNGVSLLIQEQFATYPVESMLNQTEKDVRKLHPTAVLKPMTTNLAGRTASGFEVSYNNGAGVLVHQRVFGLRRGLKIFIWIESWSLPEKRDALDQIRETIHLR
jgi:hypothetical protein